MAVITSGLCVDCSHYEYDEDQDRHLCTRKCLQFPDLVTGGLPEGEKLDCYDERDSDDPEACGPEGKYHFVQ